MKLFEAKKNKHDPRDRIHIEHEESKGQKQSMDEIQIELEESDNNDNDADNHIKKISKTLKSPVLLPRACVVAQELIRINDEADRWDLISTVWAEMVYYIAPRCGGTFHYVHLSTGGEFITHILVLMYYLGPFLPPSDA
ncbi:hypothetical protein PR202_ga22672 [Eleusine coracana subsp. coracana]|uniref:Uncharacterized protein n=1 Tax=Eleusine coracana subsp. coracana TaxID=191504 RepID=A0AAV5D3U0_ELECO|nr:hypothetical protein PR202_ga22672 [Eleusine coracana subsp. coracana]